MLLHSSYFRMACAESDSSALRLPCGICPRRFHSERALDLHRRRHKCPQCEETFQETLLVQQHIRRRHQNSDPGSTCTHCDSSFVFKHELDNHLRIEHSDVAVKNEDEYRCHLCLCDFGSDYQLKIHNKVHQGVMPHQCHLCSRQFSSPSLFTIHVSREHGDVDDQAPRAVNKSAYVCPYCEKSFDKRSALRRHSEQKHFNHSSHTCKLCGRTFVDAFTLDNHVKSHKSVKKFRCQLCPESFKNKTGLVFHMKEHSPGI